MEDYSAPSLEGRLLAQRKILARLIAQLPDSSGMRRFMQDRAQFVDGEEDPGVDPSTEFAVEYAVAAEFGAIDKEVERLQASADFRAASD